jgi:hypothetical protein
VDHRRWRLAASATTLSRDQVRDKWKRDEGKAGKEHQPDGESLLDVGHGHLS